MAGTKRTSRARAAKGKAKGTAKGTATTRRAAKA